MKICRITLDLAYHDNAEDAPKTERSLRTLIDRALDPALGDYTTCTMGVVVKDIAFPDPSRPDKVMAWDQYAERQLAILDVERFAVTHAVSSPTPIERTVKRTGKKR